jgi:hypothetical protein
MKNKEAQGNLPASLNSDEPQTPNANPNPKGLKCSIGNNQEEVKG